MTRKLRPYDQPPPQRRSLIPSAPDSAATAFAVVAVLWLTAATGIGAFAALQRLLPDLLTASFSVPIGAGLTIDVSHATALRAFVDALVLGWISNAAFAAVFFVTPRLTGARVAEPIALLGGGAWNVAVAAGVALLYVKGASGSATLMEFPLPVQGLALLGLLAINGAFWMQVLRSRALAVVSLGYFGIGLLALLGLIAIGTIPHLVSLGTTNDLLVWAFAARGIATYWVLGAALGALFYVVPRVTRNPVAWSGAAWLALGGWFAFAGLSAIGALVDPSVPYAVTSIGQAGTLLLVAPVFLAVATLLATIRGRWSLLFSPGPVPMAVTALLFLTGAALLDSVGALRSVQALTAGTDWQLGAMVLGALGGTTFALYAIVDHLVPRVLHRDRSAGVLADVQLWLTLGGTALAGLGMVGAGVISGSLAAQAASPEQIDGTVLVFRLAAAGGLGLVALGALALLINLFLLYTSGRPVPEEAPVGLDAATAVGH